MAVTSFYWSTAYAAKAARDIGTTAHSDAHFRYGQEAARSTQLKPSAIGTVVHEGIMETLGLKACRGGIDPALASRCRRSVIRLASRV